LSDVLKRRTGKREWWTCGVRKTEKRNS